MMNTTRDISPLESHAHGDLPRRTVAQNTNTLCTRGVPSSGFLPRGAERHKRTGTVPCHWRRPAVATNGGGSHFLHLFGCRVITGLGVLVTGRVEPHFHSRPTKA